jgi:UDP-glucose 4-epimerase
MTWLVTGGAGYIGAHVVRHLRQTGRPVAVFDDLSTGDRSRLPADVPLHLGDVTRPRQVAAALRDHQVRGVIHLAARKSPAESLRRPTFYHRQNVGGLNVLLRAMAEAGVDRLVFASSAAVYGRPATPIVAEAAPLCPISPYGRTKLLGERLIAARPGLSWTTLRFFNVAGAAGPLLADRSTDNLMPLACRAIDTGRPLMVFGTDYPTPDGSGVRDYIHVDDVAAAHVAAVSRLEAGPVAATWNLGSGRGYSVLDVLGSIGRAAGQPVPFTPAGRRPGDSPSVVADISAVARELGWQARLALTDMVDSAWQCRSAARPEPVTA